MLQTHAACNDVRSFLSCSNYFEEDYMTRTEYYQSHGLKVPLKPINVPASYNLSIICASDSKVTMKYVVLIFVVLAVSHVTWGGPVAQLRSTQDGSAVRVPRQSGVPAPSTPLAQLLQDALNIPQVALQAVSRLLTNPTNTIGVATNGRHNSY